MLPQRELFYYESNNLNFRLSQTLGGRNCKTIVYIDPSYCSGLGLVLHPYSSATDTRCVLVTLYLISVISPVLVVFVPSKNVADKEYPYTSMGCAFPRKLPSHPMLGSLVSKTSCPQRL